MDEKYILYDTFYPFWLILALLGQKVPKYGEGMVLSKNKYRIWTHQGEIPQWLQISYISVLRQIKINEYTGLSITSEKEFWLLKIIALTHIVSVM